MLVDELDVVVERLLSVTDEPTMLGELHVVEEVAEREVLNTDVVPAALVAEEVRVVL